MASEEAVFNVRVVMDSASIDQAVTRALGQIDEIQRRVSSGTITPAVGQEQIRGIAAQATAQQRLAVAAGSPSADLQNLTVAIELSRQAFLELAGGAKATKSAQDQYDRAVIREAQRLTKSASTEETAAAKKLQVEKDRIAGKRALISAPEAIRETANVDQELKNARDVAKTQARAANQDEIVDIQAQNSRLAAQENNLLQRILSSDEQYIKEVIEGTAQRRRLNAAIGAGVQRQLAGIGSAGGADESNEFIRNLASAQVNRRRISQTRDLLAERELAGDPTFTTTQGEVAALRHSQKVREERAAETFLAADRDLARQTGELAALRRRRTIDEQREQLRASRGDIGSEARLEEERDNRGARIARERLDIRRSDPQVGFDADQRIADQSAVEAQKHIDSVRKRAEIQRNLASQEEGLRNDLAEIQAAEAQRKLAVQRQVREKLGSAFIDAQAREDVAQSAAAERRREQVLKLTLRNEEELLQIKARNIVASRQVEQRERQIAQALLKRAIAEGTVERGTLYQRATAYAHARSGQFRLPTEGPTARQAAVQSALTTARFAATGGLLYGGLSFARELITEATELQVQLGIIESQFDTLKDAAGEVNGVTFDQFRENIIQVSRETGVAADQVAAVTRQLAGAFAEVTPEGITPNFEVGGRIAEMALQLGLITGLPQQEIADAFSATVLAFRTLDEETREPTESFEETALRISNAVVGLEARYGTGSTEILQFTASLAGQAAALGFSAEQLAAFGAVVESVVGSDVAASENFGRIFAGLQGQASEIATIFRGAGVETVGAGEDLIQPLLSALATNNIPEALRLITLGYQELEAQGSKSATSQLAALVAGERQARTFAAVMERGQAVVQALLTGEEFEGQFDARWDGYRETVQSAFERMQRAVEEFGLAIFNAGLDDVLIGAAAAAEGFAEVAKLLLDIVGGLNSAFGGLPGKILGAAFALRALTAISAGTASRGLPGFLPFGSFGAGPGGLQNARSFSPISTTRADGTIIAGQMAGGANRLFQGGGRLTRAALAGGAGGRIASAVGNLSPIIAGIAVAQLYSTIEQVGGQLDAAEQTLEEKVRSEIALGTSEAEIRERLRGLGGTNLNPFERFVSVISGGSGDSGLAIVDQLLGDLPTEDTQAFDIRRGEAALAVAEAELARRRSNTDALRESPTYDYERQVAVAEEAQAVAQAEQDAINAALEGVRNDPSAANLQNLNEVLGSFSLDSPDLQNTYKAIEAEALARGQELAAVREAAGRLQDPGRQLDFTTALALFERGEVTINEPLNFLDQTIRDLETVINEAGNNATPQQLQQLFDLQNQRTEVLIGYINSEAQITNELASLLGAGRDTPEAAIETALRAFQQISITKGVTPEQYAEAGLALAQAEQDAFAAYIDTIEDDAEAFAAAQQGFEYSDAASTALAKIQLLFGENRNVVGRVAEEIGTSADALANLIVENMVAFTEDGAEALRRIITARLNALKGAIAALSGTAFGRLLSSGLKDEYGRQQELLDLTAGLNDVILPQGGLGTDDLNGLGQSASDQAKKDREEAAKELHDYRLAEIEYRRSFVSGDSLAEADLDAQIAQENLRFARETGDRAGQLRALAEINNAARARQEALTAIGAAQRDLSLAQRGDDPVGAAYNDLADANDALAVARGAEATLLAQAAQVRAQRSLAEAFQDIGIAQLELAQAMADAAGDSVESAEIALRIAQQQLSDIQSNAPGDTAAILRAQADVVAQEAALRDSQLNERSRAIDVALQLEQITAQQAIAQLQALLQIPNLTQEQIDNILIKIKSLQDELRGDFRFNLPTELYLPTAYEVRRLDQTGSGGYNDNRVISVQVFAETNASAESIGSAVATAVGQPNRSGTIPKRY